MPAIDLVRCGMSTGMHVMLVGPTSITTHAQTSLPPDQLVTLPGIWGHEYTSQDILVQGLSAAVLASANAPAWILLPADMPKLQHATLTQLADAVIHQHPIAHTEYRCQRGRPVGFSSEFFSELISLRGERDLHRLQARYPSKAVAVSDPGVLMSLEARASSGAPSHHRTAATTR
ncbi:MAG: NTP transferase domain-containing protein [Aquabacterium sp.]|uniref:NTP transferase domain-containing protein n=1 Tax=Aquabacterium sp. TaxID=1872578 RepID=UPI003BCBB9E0